MNTIKRYPRPQGLTNLSIRYNEDKTKKAKANLNKAILAYYLNNQILYPYPLTFSKLNPYQEVTPSTPSPTKNKKENNKRQSISNINKEDNNVSKEIKKNPTHNNNQYQIRSIEYNELCLMFGQSPGKVQRLITKYLSKQGRTYLDNKILNDTLDATRASTFGLFFEALNNLRAQSGWQEELKAVSRDWGYKPSMVKEANSAISGTQSMTNQAFQMGAQLMKLMAQNPNNPGATNIQNNFYGQVPNIENGSEPLNESGYLLTPTKALELMENKGLLTMPTEAEHEALRAQYLTEDVPSTQALLSDAQGIQKKEVILLKDTGELTHEDRREEGLETLNAID